MQAHVALKRIETFLNEEEVDGQVSSLKSDNQPRHAASSESESFGLRNAYLKWNYVKELDKEDHKTDTRNGEGIVNIESDRDVETEAGLEEVEERTFELKDITIIFPQGALTLVTGPTASGKSALLVSAPIKMFIYLN